MKESLTDAAHALIKAGLSIIPISMPQKCPTGPWKQFQERLPNPGELKYTSGIALICGPISGNIEVIDIDLKHLKSEEEKEIFLRDLERAVDATTYSKFVLQKSINGGIHWIYRCNSIEPSTHLAKSAEPGEKGQFPALIETRGIGGYIIISPTNGYEVTRGDLEAIQEISVEERQSLFEACRSMNKHFEQIKTPKSVSNNYAFELTPWDDYNLQISVKEVLENNGWTMTKEDEMLQYFCRPGKSGGNSGNSNGTHFYCFTTSTVLEAGKAYSPAALYAYLECNKDFSEAAKKLETKGYGKRKPTKKKNININLFKITEMQKMESPRKIFGSLWAEGENSILFGEDGTGKSILAVNIGISIVTGIPIPGFEMELEPQLVILIDTELSDFQFNNRYPLGLPKDLKRLTFADDQQSNLVNVDIDDVVYQIEKYAFELKSQIIILDNLAALTSMIDCTKTNHSVHLMGLLNELKKKGFSVLVIDHCRKPMKESEYKAISKHDLQGSKMKSNLVDSVFSIGKSSHGENYRYIKGIKIRSFDMDYTKSSVATMELMKNPLRLEYIGRDAEWNHVNDRKAQMLQMRNNGGSQSEIAKHFGVSQQFVSKTLNERE